MRGTGGQRGFFARARLLEPAEWTLRYLTKLTLSFGILLAAALACCALAVWSIQTTAHYLERTRLAHRVYDEYLSLSNNTYQLFKQLGDQLLIGDRDLGVGEALLMDAIRSDIRDIRYLVGREVEVIGATEIPDLEALAIIDQMIEELLTEFAKVQQLNRIDEPVTYWRNLSTILDEKIDVDFQGRIEAALAEEWAEVEQAQREVSESVEHFRFLAIMAAVFAAATATVGLFLLRRSLTKPLQRLLEGAEAVGRGDFSHRISVEGDTELDRVAEALNQMIDNVAERQHGLTASRDVLEAEVERRTRELNRLLETLRHSEANRKRLIADVSHELRTPLTIIRGEADVALRSEALPSEAYRDALQRTRDAAAHTARIVDDLLLVARQEAGEARMRFVDVDLVPLLQDSVLAARRLGADDAPVSFVTDLEVATLQADPLRIKQVVMILLDNALRYGGDDIGVTLMRAPGGFAIRVVDNGVGMTDKELKGAFERFYRGAHASMRYDDGAGLGLPVAKAIVEAHGGRISLSSKKGEGVTATIVLRRDPVLAAAV